MYVHCTPYNVHCEHTEHYTVYTKCIYTMRYQSRIYLSFKAKVDTSNDDLQIKLNLE